MRWVSALLLSTTLLGAAANPFVGSDAVVGVDNVGPQHILAWPGVEHPAANSVEEHRQEEFRSTITSVDGVVYQQFAHPAFSDHRLRVTSPEICDPTVKQYSGYLDISDTRHLFFWFFEARKNPDSAPLMMWLNGGPGCSSTTGLLFENGPCAVTSPNTTEWNPYSWTNVANMIFLDEPIGTGYSYASDHSKVDTLADLAVDVYAFLQLFVSSFPQYAEKPFHLAAESWGGHYGPNIASYVHKMNKRRIYAPFPGQRHINFASLILANGLTEPATQFESVPEYLCDKSPYPPFEKDSVTCRMLRAEAPICERMIESCYRFESLATCVSATRYCWARVLGVGGNIHYNPYDIRIPCVDPDGVCYEEMGWITSWMNKPDVKRALGVDHSPIDFLACNMTTNAGFYTQGQAMHNSAALLPELVEAGIRLMSFAGNTDSVCNHIGIENWMLKLEHKHHEEFLSAPFLPFITDVTGDVGGKVRTAGGSGAGNVTYVQIVDGGHMAPHDQPEATLDMITRWVRNIPFDVIG
ncbi:alpha/beta-hydrolase [Dichomitus squalens LYAD-421 SS1]|uniref:alpha/beta-hydrolase n=1 Tax=Dichomitus squalens (strain LYAD-421) TaxID=732165 RepID=UPI00044134B4|nr:alpha/beta-hydrolase [Dichomitus squalens LYAD-421 SS1]EJF67336.1 alpha/beta-hydrolase [Dichomitus squalens LYAD-421 SS1]